MPTSAHRPDPTTYEAQLRQKIHRFQDLLAPFAPPQPALFRSRPLHYRMRAEFRLWHQGEDLFYAVFDQANKDPVRVDAFPIASEAINDLMPALLDAVKTQDALRRRLFQAEFLTTLSGEALITLVYHRPLDTAWQSAATDLGRQLGVDLVGRSRKQKITIGRDFVTERLIINGRSYTYRQPENSFTQPNAGINQHMLGWALEAVDGLAGDLLELYCGIGNFTVVLAPRFGRVLATEISKAAIPAAAHNLRANGVDNVCLARLSSAETSQALNGERPFRRLPPAQLVGLDLRTALVDPPRAGLDAATLDLVRRCPYLVYISCNPQTLARDLHLLGHRIEKLALFDQFPYTPHLECGALLRADA